MEVYEKLEHDFGEWIGVKNVVACSSGTAALHLALEALQLPPGSEVLVPDYTMIACARAVVLAGLEPVFVDCGYDLLMNWVFAGMAVSDKTRAVMPVHIYGRRLDMPAYLENDHGLAVVEDLAEAHGVVPRPSSRAACWSFYKNKIIHGEEGGAVAFRRDDEAALARRLRSLGFTEHHDFIHTPRGHNYRMSNLHAQEVLKSLDNVEGNIAKRREVEGWYEEGLPDSSWRMPPRDVVWVYDLRIPGLTSYQQHKLVTTLNENGIRARHGFKAMSIQEEFCHCRVVGEGVAVWLSREVIYLPVKPETTREEVNLAYRVITELI